MSLEQNNNTLDLSESASLKKKSVDRASAGSSVLEAGMSSLRKSKKKKKLGIFSFRSKKSSKYSNNKLTTEQSDTISLCSEVSATEEFDYSIESVVTEKQVQSVTSEVYQETHENYLTSNPGETASKEALKQTLNGGLSTDHGKSNEADNSTAGFTSEHTEMEEDSTITIVTPLTEEETSFHGKFEQTTQYENTGSLQVLETREEKEQNTQKTDLAAWDDEVDGPLGGTENSSATLERPNRIHLKSSHKFSDTLSVKRQRMFVEQNSSSTECSSYPVSPVKKLKAKKGKMVHLSNATHQLNVRLLSGEKLAARDSNGRSDPYVKFKIARKTIHKSRVCKATLNPRWAEEFTRKVNNSDKLSVMVYDYDLGRRDDFMGSSSIELEEIAENEEVELSLPLEDPDAEGEELGFIHLAVSMTPLVDEVDSAYSGLDSRTTPDDLPDNISIASSRILNERYSFSRSDSTASDISRRTALSVNADLKNRKSLKTPFATATVQLVSGTGLPARDSNGFSDPYVKLVYGKQRHKSKVCYKTLDPVWKEEFSFHLTGRESLDREMAPLEITVWDKDCYRKDDFIGRCEIDLSSLKFDKTHSLSLNLTDASGSILLLVTLHSCQSSDAPVNYTQLSSLREKYSVRSSFADLSDVGFAEVKMIRATGCRAADIGGKSDPFCVVELCNARARTHTCYKTLDPVWNKTASFPIKDIHDVLKFTVYDEDKDGEADFLGKISIPLLRAKNGEERTYALKDRKLSDRSKGSITVQISLIYNEVRAAVRTFNPRETHLMRQEPRFKRQLLLRNFQRVWNCLQAVIQTLEFINSCFTWENPTRSATAFVVYLLIVWNVELYMLPIFLLLLLFKSYYLIVVRKTKVDRRVLDSPDDSYDDDDLEDGDDQESGNKLSFLQRLNAIQEVLLKVQNILDWIASLLERIHNTFTWTVPFLSTLAAIVLSVVCVILYVIPFRTIAILWGINKFTKRLRKPNYVPNNELLDFLSRLPSDVELDEYQELSVTQGSPKNAKKKK